MSFRSFLHSLRFRLVLLTVFAISPALLIIAINYFEERKIAFFNAKQDSLRISQLVFNNHSQLIGEIQHFLYILSMLKEVREFDKDSCSRLFKKFLNGHKEYLNRGAADLRGEIFASALPMSKPVNISDRIYFKLARDKKGFSIGEYQIGRITGRPAVNFGYPILNDSGQLKGVVFVALNLDYLNKIFVKVALSKDSEVYIMSRDGIILAHYPDPGKWVGKIHPDFESLKVFLFQTSEFIELGGLDSKRRLYTFYTFNTSSQNYSNIYLSVGFSVKSILEKVDEVLQKGLSIIIIISGISLVLAIIGGNLLIFRNLDPIMRAVKRIGSGDMKSRVGINSGAIELVQLANAFDEMADSIEKMFSEEKQTKEKLRNSEERFRELCNLLPNAVFEIDLKGNVTFANQYALRLFGYDQEELDKGLNAFQFVLTEEYERAIEAFKKALIGEKSRNEFNLKKKDGTVFPVIIQAAPIIYDGKTIGLRGVAIDITDHKNIENKLRKSEQRFRELFDNAPVGYHEYNTEGRIIGVNKTELDMLGYRKDEIIGHYVWEFVVEEVSKNTVLGKLSGTIPVENTFERTYRKKDGTHLPVMITDRAIYDDDGRIIGIRSALQDITRIKEIQREKELLEKQFLQSQKMEAIGRLACGIAHDFNNLLTVIKGYSQLSLLGLNPNDPLNESLNEIQKATDKASNLIHQLLTFSRKQIMEMKVLDLNIILHDIEKMLRRIIGEDIELIMNLSDDLGNVKTDRAQIEQVVMNLVVNARDAMPDGGRLTITTANVELDEEYAKRRVNVKSGSYVMLSVSDTGCGMTREIRERIFEPFFTTKGRDIGTGLGLSTVYGIVKQSGGDILVDSEPGHGTTFKIYLPRVDEKIEESSKYNGEEMPRRNETILLIEDDESVRNLACKILEKQGYKVFFVKNEFEAVNFCKEFKSQIHLVLTDVIMPGKSGPKLIEELRSLRDDFKVLYMSGHADDSIVHHGILKKGINFIYKPFTFEGLAKKVREVLNS